MDLASEQATLKALRKQQMDKPPPVAMKKNPETVRNLTAHSQSILAPECLCSRELVLCVCWAQGEMEEFHSQALQDDLPSEEEEEAVVEIPVGDDY